jgi:hypothetical protein
MSRFLERAPKARVTPEQLAFRERVVKGVFLAQKHFSVLNSKHITDLMRDSYGKFLLLPQEMPSLTSVLSSVLSL